LEKQLTQTRQYKEINRTDPSPSVRLPWRGQNGRDVESIYLWCVTDSIKRAIEITREKQPEIKRAFDRYLKKTRVREQENMKARDESMRVREQESE
jgi:hypothetical protein